MKATATRPDGEFDLQTLLGRRKELVPASLLLTYTHVPLPLNT